MSWLTDVHVHLSDTEFSTELDQILRAMDKMRIKACCVSVDFISSSSTLELSKRTPLILPFIGIHPEKANDDLGRMVELIKTNSNRLSGIGEIGLDKSYVSDDARFDRQVSIFHEMLSLADRLNKPVSIHSRGTLDEIFSILPSYSLKGVLLHWFAGNKNQLRKAMDLGCFVSYGPAMIYSEDKQALVSCTNMDKILLETDGPVRFSKSFGQKTAQVTFLPSVLFCAANIFHKSYDEILRITENNANSYLGV